MVVGLFIDELRKKMNITDVIIIGAGAFASEITHYVHENHQFNRGSFLKIKGYLDINNTLYNRYGFNAPYLGSEEDFFSVPNQYFLIAIAHIPTRLKLAEWVSLQKGHLFTFIHHTANVHSASTIQAGCILCPNTLVGPNTFIGKNSVINYYSSITHDCIIGSTNVFCPNVTITGYVTIGISNFFGTSSTVIPNIKIGDYNKIKAGSTVTHSVSSHQLVFSNNDSKSISLIQKNHG